LQIENKYKYHFFGDKMKIKNSKQNLILFPFIFLLLITDVWAVNFDLKTCRKLATDKSEFSKSKKYYDILTEKDKINLNNMYLPQLKIEAQTTYQSDIFKLDINLPIPGFSLPEGAPNTQYQATMNLYQTIYEGGYINSASQSKGIENTINTITIQINNQKIKDNVNELYFNILAIQENIQIYNSLNENLKNKQKQIKSLLNNGVALKSSLESIDIEIIKTEQKIIQSESDKNTLLKMLAILIDDEAIIGSTLENPDDVEISYNKNNRPEYQLFESRSELYDSKKNEIYSQILPNISGFIKAGVGNPNPFNAMKNETQLFYNLGIKFQWTAWDWSNNSRSRELMEVNKAIIQTEKDNFTKNLESSLIRDKNDIEKYKKIIDKDLQILALQKNISESNYSQFENGTITITDYLTEVNNLTNAQINFSIHKIQLLSAKVNLLTKTGNY
jgi:outer membrane protein TolC